MNSIEIVKEVLASDIIGWILACLGGVIIYKVIDNMQTKMERHSVIKEVENSINAIFSAPIAMSNKQGDGLNKVTVRTVLHDETPWEKYEKDPTKVKIENFQRYICIRSNNAYEEYISTQAIHELCILYRRIEKLYKDSILTSRDLADLWREILPMGISGRLEFIYTYFGASDAESIAYVVANTYCACMKHKTGNAVEYFKKNYLNCDEDIKKIFLNNTRYGWIEGKRIAKKLYQ